jgi:Uncharacterized protein conserved in bacteria (DUF2252)
MSSASATRETPVVAATEAYEDWLRERTDVVEADLKYKHEQMKESLFTFLRGTFYRWAALWPAACPELAKAPQVLAVGDLHVENFGTWRDLEGRLVWGVNDFDEVATMPYAADLVRIVTSAMFAKRENGLTIDDETAADAVLQGYTQSLEAGGIPFVLEESHATLRAMAINAERDPVPFWAKMTKLPSATPPKHLRRLLGKWLPDDAEDIIFVSRIAGVGSLGRPRYVAIASCNGGLAAREAKAWLPSAWGWARGKIEDHPYAPRVIRRAVRQSDPYYSVHKKWVTRRLAPHCGRIELAQAPKHRDEREILKAMGRETANLHLGTKHRVGKVMRDLSKRKAGWLLAAAEAMAKATKQDWQDFKASTKSA